MQKAEIDLIDVGYCKHFEFIVKKGGSFSPVKFPSIVAVLKYENKVMLFDTGYGRYFFEITKKFPKKLYALVTPVTLEKSLCEKLETPVNNIFISHFHADHIGGLRDFPNAKIYCSKIAYNEIIGKDSCLTKIRRGLLPDLLPKDFKERVDFIENSDLVDLPLMMKPFKKGYLIEDRFFAVELKGHATGQYGLLVDDTFFVGDAVWDIDAILKNKKPHFLTHFMMKDVKEYYKTIEKLIKLHHLNPTLKIIPTHCTKTYRRYKNV